MKKILLSKPVKLGDTEVKELEIDLNSLTGIDVIEAENEIRAIGKVPLVHEMDKAYLAAIAARAIKPKQTLDFLLKLPLKDFTVITAQVQNFLLDIEV
ncbi:phage tail assembly protein [Caloramator sp. CAR-1]|uniref:phage tail assembly protein n=1 Tax=Caloramator sp. CAR-1 TaxID=3062777 RepID=UPI0026E14C72|nr:phage tail assembly protein [Caloramator sp. CAR-1]MDO6355278.1 phage tail assembly protein [Caloramator sp. CAR-1]